MVNVPTAESVVTKWKRSLGNVPASYSEGIDRATNWQANAIAGEQVYAARIQEAIANGKRAKGIAKVSDSSWKTAAKLKGAARIGPGMAAAEADFRTGISEVLNVIAGVTLPPKTGDVRTDVNARVGAIAEALHNYKKNK